MAVKVKPKDGTCEGCTHTEDRKKAYCAGPWDQEPDRLDFVHSGFNCLLHRNDFGAWCGYVGVPEDHPWHGVGYDHVKTKDGDYPEGHGGLTYANHCVGPIGRVPKPGEPDHLYWLGFDCAHCHDYSPFRALPADSAERFRRELGYDYGAQKLGETYRDIAYVRAQTERLATFTAEVA